MTMDMERFRRQQEKINANSGQDFGNIPKLVVANGIPIRLIGDFESVWEHFLIGPQGNRPYYCEGPESDCPICALVSQWSVSEDKDLQTKAQNIKAKERFYFNILERSPAGDAWHKANKQAKVLSQTQKGFSIGSMLFRKLGEVCNMRASQGQESDPTTFDIVLGKTGSGMNTEYSAQFSGMMEPLTDDEKAYKLWPLKKLAKVTERNELQNVADFLLGKPAATDNGGSQQQTSTTEGTAAGPMEQQQQQQQASAATPGPQPVSMPNSQVEQPPKANQKLSIKPKVKEPEYQDTTPREGENIMTVPCAKCGVNMSINMEDGRDIKCHGCGTVYDFPGGQEQS